jgi:hypothetical protein
MFWGIKFQIINWHGVYDAGVLSHPTSDLKLDERIGIFVMARAAYVLRNTATQFTKVQKL